MKTTYPEYWPQFYIATIYKWQHLLADVRCAVYKRRIFFLKRSNVLGIYTKPGRDVAEKKGRTIIDSFLLLEWLGLFQHLSFLIFLLQKT